MALLKLGGAVVLLLFLTPLFTEAQLQDQDALGYYVHELDALQMIWADWSKSTPNRDSNLAGWSSTQKYPCSGDFFLYSSSSNKSEYIYRPNWRGILCVNKKFNDTYQTFVIGLSLHNASIVGTLPPAIGNFSSLTTLELTGNRKLTGPLPELMSPSLRTLDLHDNAFYGSLPNLPATILNADLSGNKFVGEFRLQVNKHLQTLNLARNQFNDSNLTNAFINRTQLVSLDLSTNKLTGPLPNLTTCRNL